MPQDIIINVRANTAQADKQLQNTERLVTKLYNSANNLVTAFQEQGRAAQQAWSSGIQPLLNGIVGLSSRTSGAIHAMNSLERINQRLVASTRNYASALAGLDFSRLNTLVGTMGSLAASFNRAKAALDDMSKSLATLNARTKDIHVTTHNAIAGFGRLGVTAREYLAYRGIKAVGLYADRYQDWINKLTASTGSQEAARGIIPNLHKVADSARADIDSIVTLYSRLNLANDHLKLKEDELITVTKALSQSFILSGATSQEAKNAIIQFTQAISKGYLNGDELRSVTEQNIVFTRLLAKEMNTTAGGLRDLGAKGLLTAETLVKVLKNAAEELDKQIAKMPVTFGQALQKMANAWQMTFSKIANDKQLGQSLVALTDALTKAFSNSYVLKAMGLLIDSMKYLAENMHLVTGAAAGFIVQTRIIAPLLVKLRHGATAAGLAITTLKHALRGLIGLGVGAVIGLVVDKIVEWADSTNKAVESANAQLSVFDTMTDRLGSLADSYDAVTDAIRNMTLEELKSKQLALSIGSKGERETIALAAHSRTWLNPKFASPMALLANPQNYVLNKIQNSSITDTNSLVSFTTSALASVIPGEDWRFTEKGIQLRGATQILTELGLTEELVGQLGDKAISIAQQVSDIGMNVHHFSIKDFIAATVSDLQDATKQLSSVNTEDAKAALDSIDKFTKNFANSIKKEEIEQLMAKQATYKELAEAAKVPLLTAMEKADFGKILLKTFGNKKEDIAKAFSGVFDSEESQDALRSSLQGLTGEIKQLTTEEVDVWKKNIEEKVSSVASKFSLKGDAQTALASFVRNVISTNLATQEQAIANEAAKGYKSAFDTAMKQMLATGQIGKLADPKNFDLFRRYVEEQANVSRISAKFNDASKLSADRIKAYTEELNNARGSVKRLSEELAAAGINISKLDKEVYNYQKAITQNATSELMSLIGKGGTVDDKALEAIFERAKIKEEIKKEQTQLVADLEAAGDSVGIQMHIMETRVKVINELIKKEHEWGKAIESRIEIANRDKEIQKQLDAFAKKGGKSEDIRPIVETGFAINSLTKDLENLLEKSDYLRSGGFASSIRDAMLQFIEQLGESKQLLIDTQYEILKANKAMDGTDTLLRNIAEAIKLINEKGGIKNLSASELAEVQRISSNTKNALNKLNAEKDRLDELIAKLEGVKKSFEGVANAVLFVVKVMSAFGVVSKELVAKIEGMRDDLLQRIGAGIESAKATKDALTSKIAEMSTPFDTLNGLIKDTKDGTDRLGKSIEDLGEPLNSVDKAMHKWIEFQQNIPSFAETLESNMESAAKSVMNWKMDMVDAVSDVGSGIVKALVKGEDAMDSLKNTLSSLADHFIDMSIRMLTYQAFWGLIGGGMGMGGGLFSGLGAGLGSLFGFHQGGVIGSDSPTFIRKYHTGGIIGSDEELAILQNGEGVFTRGQMQAIGEGMSANRGNVTVDVRFDPSLKGEVTTEQEVIEQDNQMTKVVLNVIRNNKRTVSSMLGSNTRSQ